MTIVKSWLLVMTKNQSISYLRKTTGTQSFRLTDIGEADNFYIPQTSPRTIINQSGRNGPDNDDNALPPKCKEVFHVAKSNKFP